MTYNFDPDRWYENERAALEARYKAGGLNEKEYTDALSALDRKYDDTQDRLDGTYQIPK
jgi:hypothetical protein